MLHYRRTRRRTPDLTPEHKSPGKYVSPVMDLVQFRYYTDWHAYANEQRYAAPADPWTLLDVDPASVDRYNTELPLNWGLGRVEDGDWDSDEYCHSLEETVIYRGLRERFEEGFDWGETALYQWAASRFEAGESVRGYECITVFRDVRLAHLDDLFHSIREEGYRSNEDATHEPPTDDNPLETAYANHLDPIMLIGRTGELLLTEGFHWFALATILELDSIPVLVLCRHVDWQQRRDDLFQRAMRNRTPSASDSHPDLQNLIG